VPDDLILSDWQLRPDGADDWRPARAPGCWEEQGLPKDWPGPVWLRTALHVPPEWAGRRVWLQFGAVSYHCELFLDGLPLAAHTGMWDTFELELTDLLRPGAPAELLLRVEKPASPTGGPDAPSVPGRFPLRETLAGFLPYVWGHSFGGIWQPAWLRASGPAHLLDACARGAPDGQVEVACVQCGPGPLRLTLLDPDGAIVHQETLDPSQTPPQDGRPGTEDLSSCAPLRLCGGPDAQRLAAAVFTARLPDPRPWDPERPERYTARLEPAGGELRELRFGLRALRAEGAALLLNGRPIYPRMVLSWGWYPERLCPDPGPARVRADLLRLKELGYNGVKLCLWFPPPYYFELADELGMLLWVELPLWLPRASAHMRRQLPLEYDRLARQARRHPSVIIYTLGCELNRAVGADLLGPLFALVKRLGGDALVRDNSGSGEAYGGLLDEHAEFYDYHFYSEPPLLHALIESFSPRWRPSQPWLFGEFCDYDTLPWDERPTTKDEAGTNASPSSTQERSNALPLQRSTAPTLAWWLSPDPAVNPQGARWQYERPWLGGRLRAVGYAERAAELARQSERQGLLHRKHTLELVRTYQEIGGYVVSGEIDTPVTTAGMWDERGRLKYDPRELRMCNSDLVLLLSWGRRRAWVAGGDRAAPWDGCCPAAGSPVRAELIAAHHGRARGPAEVEWELGPPGAAPWAAGCSRGATELEPGCVRQVAVAELVAPHVGRPQRAALRATLRIGAETAANQWTVWVFPRDPWRGLGGVGLLDPAGRLDDLPALAPGLLPAQTDTGAAGTRVGPFTSFAAELSVVVATLWTEELADWVALGGAAVLLQGHGAPGPFATVRLPFWREALKLAEPHPAWGDFPTDEVGVQFFASAPDCALATAGAPVEPLLRRIDTRSAAVHDYAAVCAWGAGHLIVSTLRPEGGLGDQPLGLARSPAASHMLARWVRYLLGIKREGQGGHSPR